MKSRSSKRALSAAGSAPPDTGSTTDAGEPPAQAGLFVVALGASAGGLEAIQQFLRSMPANSGAALFVVSHLDPDHASLLAEILQRVTEIPVVEAMDRMAIAADHVYVMLPDREMTLSGGVLRVTKPSLPRGQRMPIDHFFRSVAQDCAARAIGVVLSGTGSDGALGLQAILAAGGVGLVQDPATAKFEGMPASALAASPDARVLAPERMPEALLAMIPEAAVVSTSAADPAQVAGLRRVLAALRNRTGNDFSQYKMTTIGRRVARRMAEHGIADTAVYARFVEEKAEEAQALLDEVLINVTSFFRDPVAFDVLKADVLPAVLAELPDDAVFRVWVAGCSTGEEAYSLAIVLRELIEEKHRTVDVQIFATDIDESAIAIARGATYPKSIAADVGAERLRRFFFEEGTEYRVAKSIREMVVFAVQNMVRDPAFTRLDLLSCRNVLIYLEAPLQDRLTATFHYALKPGGVLFLSPSESVGGDGELFRPIDRRWKIYRPIPRPAPPARTTAWSLPTLLPMSTPEAPVAARVKGPAINYAELTRRALLQAFGPPSVLTDASGNILFVHGDTGRCLRPAPGQATFNVVEMAREELQTELRMAFSGSAADGELPRVVDVSIDTGDGPLFVQLGVRRIADGGGRPLMLVSFAESSGAPTRKRRRTGGKSSDAERIESLERRIAYTSENLHATIEEKQAAIEELQSTNEEMQSTSEEMQSTNEELETSKEELQSLNEEMSTVNAELEAKIEDLMDIQNDLKNLMDNVTVGTIFLDRHLAIRRFTRESERIYRLVPTDVGRPLSDFHADVDEDLLDDARTVLATLVPRARDVRTRSGDWFMARIQPYRTIENMIDGVVLTFTDISDRVKAEAALHASGALAEAIVNTVREPLVVLDGNFHVVSASPAFVRLVGGRRVGLIGWSLFTVAGGAWDQPGLRRALEDVLPNDQAFENLEISFASPPGMVGTFLLNGRRLENGISGGPLILLAVESRSPPGDRRGRS